MGVPIRISKNLNTEYDIHILKKQETLGTAFLQKLAKDEQKGAVKKTESDSKKT